MISKSPAVKMRPASPSPLVVPSGYHAEHVKLGQLIVTEVNLNLFSPSKT
jgi:hypothetical protein